MRRLRLVARGLPPLAGIDFAVAGTAVMLRRIDDQAIGIAAVPAPDSALINLQADVVPEVVELWTFRELRTLAPTVDAVPASLLPPPPDLTATDTQWEQRVTASLRDGRLDEAFGELADVWLEGTAQDRAEVSRRVLAHLAAHPFKRSPGLGALIATFCNA